MSAKARYLQPSERDIEKCILEWLALKQLFAFKIKSVGIYDQKQAMFRRSDKYYRKGAPDIVVVFKGKFIGLEVKSKTGKQRIDQRLFGSDVMAAGGEYYVVRSIEDVMKVFIDR